MLSVAEFLILFDHVLLAILFLIALFCTVSAVSASLYSSKPASLSLDDDEEDVEVVETTDTCYSVRNGTSILIESDLKDVV